MQKTPMIELLAPARDAEIGIEAFRHGADAVYIGAPRFSARAAAGNSIADIERLAAFGHQYGARTHVAFNTILWDRELPEAERLIWQLYEAGVDALIVQDMGLLKLNLPPIALHASTQNDNRTLEKVRLMRELGFSRVVLARELSLAEIAEIHRAVPDVELECFVHGALCVCVSGQCYLSAAMTGRSANRGECAQPCRLPMDLLDANGRTIVSQRHLLSLRDMNRSEFLGDLIEAGVCSFKIEGRLKDMAYVKNVTAYYRRKLDQWMEGHDVPLESHTVYTFDPRPEKSFNRGFTSYFADGKRGVMWNFDSPKSMGEPLGDVREVGNNWFRISSPLSRREGEGLIHNGDGLVCDRTIGFRANRVDEQGRIFPLGGPEVCRQLRQGMEVRRNSDIAFDQLLAKPSAQRRVPIDLHLSVSPDRLSLTLSRRGCSVDVELRGLYEPAKKSQEENIRQQLSKLGDSIYEASSIEVEGSDLFVPSSQLGQLRREGVAALDRQWMAEYEKQRRGFLLPKYEERAAQIDGTSVLPHDYLANVLNGNARDIFRLMGVENVGQAFEQQSDNCQVVMQTRHCLRMALGRCPKYPVKGEKMEPVSGTGTEPWTLKIGKEKFILKFGCKNSCMSEIIRIFAPEK